jgi:RNA polymerase sigma-70 factor, ECF subfamily
MLDQKKYEDKSDEEIVKMTIENSDFYFFLMKRYEDKLLRYIQRISGVSEEVGQDILQEVFLKVYQNLLSFDFKLKFSSWIYRIARNTAISYWRKNKKDWKNFYLEDNEMLKNSLEAQGDMEKDLLRKMNAENIKKIMCQIKPVHREVLTLKFLEDKNYEEISDIIKKPIGTVATLIFRAKKDFRNVLDKVKIELE